MSIFQRLTSHITKHRLILVAMFLGALLLPALAMAIPGSGDFTSTQSPTGREISDLFNWLSKICLVIFILVATTLVFAIARFRRKSDDEMPEQVHGNAKVELGLFVAASITQIVIGIKTIDVMWYVEKIPEDTTVTVEAIAYQWDWQFRYPDHGGFISDDLVVPAHQNIRLEVTSKDVIHSIFIPELGVKMDAVPGRFNYWWFNANGPINQVLSEEPRSTAQKRKLDTTRTEGVAEVLNALNFFESYQQPTQLRGLEQRVDYLAKGRKVGEVSPYAKYDAVEYRGMCTELCGKGHYDMYFRTVAMTQASFDQWVEDMKSGGDGEVDGGALYQKNCATCHGDEGAGVPPQFPPLAGSDWVVQDDEENKATHINVVLKGLRGEIQVNGVSYNGVMQPWYNALNDEEVAAVVNHERTSWGNNGGTVTADQVAALREEAGYPPYPAGGAVPVDARTLLAEGEKIYEACVSCHGVAGKGLSSVGNLAKNPTVLSDPKAVLDLLVNGNKRHSAMGRTMSDRELAATLTYIRGSFGNKASAVQPDEVKRIRGDVQKPLEE